MRNIKFFVIITSVIFTFIVLTGCLPFSYNPLVIPEMVLVEIGTFQMGDTWGDGDSIAEKPVHEVTLTYDFYIGKYEVTFDEYGAFCDDTEKSKPYDAGWKRGQHPVINVSWWDAIAYCNWLSEQEGLPKAYDEDGNLLDKYGNETTDIMEVKGYRLPTEAEWEYAARGGKYSNGYKYSGSNDQDEVAWYWDNSGGHTHEVGTKKPNELGIYDMSGNVWEWCQDRYDSDYYERSPKTNPYNHEKGSLGRVVRGGSWNNNAHNVRVANRYYRYNPDDTNNYFGFRVCRTAKTDQLPTVTKVSGPSEKIDESSVTFKWSGNDPDGTLERYECRKDGGNWEDNSLSTTYEWSGYAKGDHTFEVRAQDNDGVYSDIIIWNFTYKISIAFANCFGGSDFDYAYSIQQTSDGGYIVAGRTSSNDGDVTGNHGGSDYWVVKLDETGDIQWQRCLGGSDYDYAYSIQQTSDDGYIFAGYTSSNDGDVTGNHGGGDYWVVKLDETGNIQWQRCLGGSKWDEAQTIQETSDGGYIVAGSTCSNDGDVTGNHGGSDYWVVKLDETGDIQWQKCFGGSDTDAGMYVISSIQQTSDGGYIFAGYTFSNDGDVTGNHGSGDYWVVKLDETGDIQWQRCLGGSDSDRANSIQETSDGGYIVAGRTESNDGDVFGNRGDEDYWVVKLDETGDIQWQKCLGGSVDDIANSILQTSDDGYIVAGSTCSNDGDVTGNHGEYDYWIMKLE